MALTRDGSGWLAAPTLQMPAVAPALETTAEEALVVPLFDEVYRSYVTL